MRPGGPVDEEDVEGHRLLQAPPTKPLRGNRLRAPWLTGGLRMRHERGGSCLWAGQRAVRAILVFESGGRAGRWLDARRRPRCPLAAPGSGRRLPARVGLAESGNRPFGIYVHVPFCTVCCGYCDFNTYTAEELGDQTGASLATYAEAAITEVRLPDMSWVRSTCRPRRSSSAVGRRPLLGVSDLASGVSLEAARPADPTTSLRAASSSSPVLRSPAASAAASCRCRRRTTWPTSTSWPTSGSQPPG
jgi:hypothetical protein